MATAVSSTKWRFIPARIMVVHSPDALKSIGLRQRKFFPQTRAFPGAVSSLCNQWVEGELKMSGQWILARAEKRNAVGRTVSSGVSCEGRSSVSRTRRALGAGQCTRVMVLAFVAFAAL